MLIEALQEAIDAETTRPTPNFSDHIDDDELEVDTDWKRAVGIDDLDIEGDELL